MPSFDIVSKLDLAEVDNALAGIAREISTRFDFKGSKSTVTMEKDVMTILADDEMKLRQVQELVKMHMTRRKIETGALDFKTPEKAAGQSMRQVVGLKQGLDQELAKKITRSIKDSKLKVQASIQGDELRISGKKRDDLQEAIAHVRGMKIEQPLQYVNFRD